jgi:DNA-binding CsgD family transcriptional regulator/tetratricopeptide (TPR) repeat protein
MGETIWMEEATPRALTGSRPRSLLGRAEELTLISAFLDRATRSGDAMLLVGEPGIGKTVLLDAAAERASADGVRVLRASGVEFETDIPFAGLHQVLVPLTEEFEQLPDPHRGALDAALGFGHGPTPDRLLVCHATLTLVRMMSQARPLLIVVDDLQWIDRATAPVLGFVARRLSGTAAGFLAALRGGPVGFFERAGLTELELPPLDEATAGVLMRSRYPLLPAMTRRRLLAAARGNPLAVLELPQGLNGHGPDLAGHATALPLGRRLQRLYASRLDGLPKASRDALLMLALDGTGDIRVLDAIPDGGSSLAALGPAEQSQLVGIRPGSRRLAFGHPLIRAAVVAMATAEERRMAHRRLAELLRDQPERRAWHLGEATIEPDGEVAASLERSAQAILRRGDGAGAVAALIKAAELSLMPRDRARRLATAAYIGAKVNGDLRDADALLADARRTDPDCAGSVEAATAASFILLNDDGDVAAAHRLLLRALRSADARQTSPTSLAEALWTLMLVCSSGGHADLWEPLGRQLAHGHRRLPASLSLTAALTSDPARSPRAAVDHLDAAIETLANLSDPAEVVRIAGAASLVDRLPACRQALRRVTRDEPETGAVTCVIIADILLAAEAFLTGQWDEAQRLSAAAAELCDTCHYRLLHWNARAVGAFVAAARGRPAVAHAVADEMIQWAAPRDLGLLRSTGLYACVLAALAQSDFEAAYRSAVTISPAGQLAPHEPVALWVIMDLVEAALRTGRVSEAAAHVRAVHEAGVAAISSRLALLSGVAAALVAPDEEAIGRFEQSLAIAGAEQWPFDFARAQLLYGERLRRAHAMTESRVQLGTALDTFRRLGATPWAERAAQELRATGQVRPRGADHDREALTPQELEIATLAAAGLTNKNIASRLFLSHRTVGAHLYRVFPKLGITSRAALRDALPQRSAG